MQYERVVFVLEIYFRFSLLQLYLQAMSRQILPIRSALPIQDVKIYTYNNTQLYWRKEHVSAANIFWRRRIHILNRCGGSNFQDDYAVYIASPS